MQGISLGKKRGRKVLLLMDNRTGGIKAAIGGSTFREGSIVFCKKTARFCAKTTYRLCASTRNEKYNPYSLLKNERHSLKVMNLEIITMSIRKK